MGRRIDGVCDLGEDSKMELTSFLSDVFISATGARKVSMLMKSEDENLEASVVQKRIVPSYGKDWVISKTELIGTKLIALISKYPVRNGWLKAT